MNPDIADTYATMIEELLPLAAALREAFPKPIELPQPPPIPVVYEKADTLAAAMAGAKPGDVLLVSPSLIQIALLNPPVGVTVKNAALIDGRMSVDFPCPTFLGGAKVNDGVKLIGLDVRHPDPAAEIVTMPGKDAVIDRCRVLGDPVKGGKRGIRYSGGNGRIVGCYIDDIFQPAQDTQAIYSDSMNPTLVVDDCHLSAAGQPIMLGGGDSITEARIPRGVRITRSTLTKKPFWLELVNGKPRFQCKPAIEFKNCIDVTVDDCDLEYGGTSQGQGGYLIVGTPRNQSGREPWSIVKDVKIANCRGRHASGIATFLGDDNLQPSQPLSNFMIDGFTAEDLNPALYGGPGRIFFINRGTTNVHLLNITATGSGLKSYVYCDEKKPPTGLVVRNFKAPAGLVYAYHNLLGNTLASLKLYAPDAVLEP